jgi:hypothetical protein
VKEGECSAKQSGFRAGQDYHYDVKIAAKWPMFFVEYWQKADIMSTVIITSEEWSVLLGNEAKSVKARGKTYRDKHLNSANFRQPRQIFCVESEPARSLRDLISNDEISALLAPHPIK